LNKILNITFSSCLLTTSLFAYHNDKTTNYETKNSVRKSIKSIGMIEPKKISTVDKVKSFFSDGKVTGQIRSMYAGYDYKTTKDISSTALGGILKYETAKLYNLSAGVAFNTSNDINLKNNPELSSSKGNYTVLSEAYLNYKYNDFNLRVGRQKIDTPLADSDDIRMIDNSFKGYVATYEANGFNLMLGHLQEWQGYDAGLNDGWIKTGTDGTNFGGISYNDIFTFNIWYYNITKQVNAIYLDSGMEYKINQDLSINGAVQYLNEQELDNSQLSANIYGANLELTAFNIGLNFAYNHSDKQKQKASFSGFGGGTLYTSMDTMILDEITEDRSADAYVSGIVYHADKFSLLYAYGEFYGVKNSVGVKEHILEQNIGVEYDLNEDFIASAVYVIREDKQNSVKTENDWNRAQIMLTYNF